MGCPLIRAPVSEELNTSIPISKKKLILLGLEGAGKTSILCRLKGKPPTSMNPTIGLNIETICLRNLECLIFDIGGKARSLWSHYYENLNACIFVVDSTDKEKLYQVREEFVKLNEDLKFQNVTLLVFFNKHDCKDLIETTGVKEVLEMDVMVQMGSARTGEGVNEGIEKLIFISMLDLAKEIDFSAEISENPSLEGHIQAAAWEISEKTSDSLKKPFLDTQFNKIAIISNLPKIPKEKLATLDKVLVEKLLGKLGLTQSVTNQFYDFQEDGKTTSGSAIFEFDSPENALKAVESLNDTQLDKNHTLKFYSVEAFDKIMKTSNIYEPPKILKKSDLQKWLLDSEFRDQYFFHMQKGNSKIFVNWFDHLEKKPSNAIANEYVETNEVVGVDWSQNGSYLILLNKLGFELYGGESMEKVSTFEHLSVKKISVSPNEKYILSFNGTINEAPNTEADRGDVWGSFQWSYDSNYLGRISESQGEEKIISVYKVPDLTLLENDEGVKSFIKIQNVQKFGWIENTKLLCCVSHSCKNKEIPTPVQTKVTLLEIPSRKEPLKWKSITWEVVNCDIISHTGGEWVALIMTKKQKKTFSTLIHVADLKKKTAEISDVEFPEKYMTYSYDRKNGRFCFIIQEFDTKDLGGHIKYDFLFYQIDYSDMIIKACGKFTKRGANEFQFASNSTFFALINKDPQSATQGVIDFGFFKASGNTIAPEIIKSVTMPYMNMASYDPSGRFLITGSKETKTYIVWNANGDQVYKDTLNGDLMQVGWRKRPQNLLEKEKEQEIMSKFKVYKTRFEEHDDLIINKLKHEMKQKRKVMKNNFLAFIEKKKKIWENAKNQFINLRGFDEDNLEDLSMEEIVESEIIEEEKPKGKKK